MPLLTGLVLATTAPWVVAEAVAVAVACATTAAVVGRRFPRDDRQPSDLRLRHVVTDSLEGLLLCGTHRGRAVAPATRTGHRRCRPAPRRCDCRRLLSRSTALADARTACRGLGKRTVPAESMTVQQGDAGPEFFILRDRRRRRCPRRSTVGAGVVRRDRPAPRRGPIGNGDGVDRMSTRCDRQRSIHGRGTPIRVQPSVGADGGGRPPPRNFRR